MNTKQTSVEFPEKAVNKLEELLSQRFEMAVGFVIMDADTANFTIIDKDGNIRMMVTGEFTELMKPTEPCFQLNMQKISREIFKKI